MEKMENPEENKRSSGIFLPAPRSPKRRIPGLRRRSPVVSGIFYPATPEALTSRLASWGLAEGSRLNFGGGQVIIAPHGAWELTGHIAGAAFETVQKRKGKPKKGISRIFLLGAWHGSDEEGIYLSESAFFETPLGDLLVDQDLNKELASCSTLIRINDIPHLYEHSLEVLLPLVKFCFPKAIIVPILVSGTRSVLISGLAKALRLVLEKDMEENLVVVSSNLSKSPDPALALSMADELGSLLESMNSKAFLSRLAKGGINACGCALIGALLKTELLHGRHFASLCPMEKAIGDKGETVFFGAFGA
jgi:AmmeMemoRadiSam system protein B